MPALDLPRLSLAALRGMTVAAITAPLCPVAAELLRPRLAGLPVTPWLAAQLALAVWFSSAVGAACWLAWREALATRVPRSELVATACLLGAGLGHVSPGPHALTLGLTCLGALTGGALAGGLVWRGSFGAGAGLGSMAGLAGVGGALFGGLLLSHPIEQALQRSSGAGSVAIDVQQLGACLACANLAAGFLVAYGTSRALAAADPLLAHSVLERPQRSA